MLLKIVFAKIYKKKPQFGQVMLGMQKLLIMIGKQEKKMVKKRSPEVKSVILLNLFGMTP